MSEKKYTFQISKENMYIHGNCDLYVPAHLNFGRFLLEHIKNKGENIAITNAETGENINYTGIAEYAVKLAVALSNLGIRKDDIVAFGAEKRLMNIPTVIGVTLSGATYTPIDISCGRAHLRHMLSITQPKLFITTKLFWKAHQETIKKFDCIEGFFTLDEPSDSLISIASIISSYNDIDVSSFEPQHVIGQVDTAIILYSSGTTGMPKGVEISHLNAILYSLPHDFKDKKSIKVAYIDGEWYHDYDIFMTYKMLVLGVKVVFSTAVALEDKHDSFSKEQVNIIFLVPTILNLLTKLEKKSHENLECLKYVYTAASPVHKKTMEKFKERFPSVLDILQGYGMTEIWVVTCENCSPKGPKLGSVGSICPCITLKVEHLETRELLGPNQPGEICAKGPQLMKGYRGMDPASYLDEDGFLRTGDLGYYDDDGYFYIVDRIKEIIDFQGYKLAPLELETILLIHPGVKEVGVVGKKINIDFEDEEPTAFVVRQPGSTVSEKELIEFANAELPPFFQLKSIRFVPELPKSPRGKILRRRLRELVNEE